MSAASSLASRQLETIFQAHLQAALSTVAGLAVRRFSEPVASAAAGARIPAVVVAAAKREDWEAMRVNGRTGELCDLSFDCRAGGEEEVESLARAVLDAIGTIQITSGWLYLHIESDGEERDFEGATRSIKLKFLARCLTAP